MTHLTDVIEEEKAKFLEHPSMKRLCNIELTAIITGRAEQYTGETLDVAFTQAMQKAALAVVDEILAMTENSVEAGNAVDLVHIQARRSQLTDGITSEDKKD